MTSSTDPPQRNHLPPWAYAVAIFLLVGLVFAPLLGAEFLLWDDNINTYRNPWYLPLSWENTGRFWVETYNKTYRPLVHTAWAAIAWVSYSAEPLKVPGDGSTQFEARVFHGVNLFLHAFNGVLVWRLCRRFVQSGTAALLGTLLFLLHPVQVESVGWVTGFNELLCATFCLGSLFYYLNWLDGQAGKTSAGPPYALAFGLFLLALLVKPAAVALPLVFWVFGTLLHHQKPLLALRTLGPFLVTGALWSLVTALAHPPEYAGAATPLWTRPLIAGDALAFYAGKLLLPLQLGIDYGRRPHAVMQGGWVWAAWLVPVLLFAWCWFLRRRSVWPMVVYLSGLAWLLPVCGLKPFHFQLVYSTVADRYLYFVLVPLALALAVVLETNFGRRLRPAVVLLIVAWGFISFRQATTWQNNFTVFGQALTVNSESWMANANLGAAHDVEGRQELARPYFEAALRLKPDLWQMHIKLARYAQAAGQIETARNHWASALKIRPDLQEAQRGLRRFPPP